MRSTSRAGKSILHAGNGNGYYYTYAVYTGRRSILLWECRPADLLSSQQKGLLASNQTCSGCHVSIALGHKRDISDAYIFRCSCCKTTKSLRAGSFFSKSKLPLQKWLVPLYWWIRQYPVGDAAEEAKVSREAAINVYQWLREVCSTKPLANPIALGGPGKTVQIDESLFRHKPKVSYFTGI